MDARGWGKEVGDREQTCVQLEFAQRELKCSLKKKKKVNMN